MRVLAQEAGVVTGFNHGNQKYGVCQLQLDIFIASVHVPLSQLLPQAALVNFSCQVNAPPTDLNVRVRELTSRDCYNYIQLYRYCKRCTSCTMLVQNIFKSTKDIF